MPPPLSGDINLWHSGQKDLNLRAIQLIYFQTPDMVEHQKMRIRFSRKKNGSGSDPQSRYLYTYKYKNHDLRGHVKIRPHKTLISFWILNPNLDQSFLFNWIRIPPKNYTRMHYSCLELFPYSIYLCYKLNRNNGE